MSQNNTPLSSDEGVIEIPKGIYEWNDRKVEQILKDAGVEFLDTPASNPDFQYVRIPQGWKHIKGEGKEVHLSQFVDEKGHIRLWISRYSTFEIEPFIALPRDCSRTMPVIGDRCAVLSNTRSAPTGTH